MYFDPTEDDDIIVIEIPSDIEDADDEDGDFEGIYLSTDEELEIPSKRNVSQVIDHKEENAIYAAKRTNSYSDKLHTEDEIDISPRSNSEIKAAETGVQTSADDAACDADVHIKTENSDDDVNDDGNDDVNDDGNNDVNDDGNDDTNDDANDESEALEFLEDEVNGMESALLGDKAKLPEKYLLFDDMMATVIGFDDQDTPIVEFTPITRAAAKSNQNKLPTECGICPTIVKHDLLPVHLKLHMTDSGRFKCEHCAATHINRNSAAAHARRHLGVRPFACQVCDNYFTTKNDLKLHHQRKHTKREFICEVCGKSYAQNTFLKRHIRTIHEGIKQHMCSYCPKAYHRRGNLKEHIEAVHLGQRKPLNCRFCGQMFRDSHRLAAHRKEEHLNKSHFQCVPCDVTFSDIQFFNAHKRSIQCRDNRPDGDEVLHDSEAMQLAAEEDELMHMEKQELSDDSSTKELPWDAGSATQVSPSRDEDLRETFNVPVELFCAKQELPELEEQQEKQESEEHTVPVQLLVDSKDMLRDAPQTTLDFAQLLDDGRAEHKVLDNTSDHEQKILVLKEEPLQQEDDGVEYLLF